MKPVGIDLIPVGINLISMKSLPVGNSGMEQLGCPSSENISKLDFVASDRNPDSALYPPVSRRPEQHCGVHSSMFAAPKYHKKN